MLVVAGFEPLKFATPALEHWLRRLDNEGVTLGAIDTGSFILAEAGLLEGHRLTLHWEAIDAFKELYRSSASPQELFEIDRRRITSAGGAGIHLFNAGSDRPRPTAPELAIQVERTIRARPHLPAQRPPAHGNRHALWHVVAKKLGARDRRDMDSTANRH